MYRLIYTSTATSDLSPKDISLILSKARLLNQRDGITGMLLYHNRRIIQVLEGAQSAVEACYARITKDSRHGGLTVAHAGPAGHAIFTDWFMGYENPDSLPPLAQIAGGKTLITLEQLRDRLRQSDSQQAMANRNDVISTLHQFMVTADNSGGLHA